MGRAVLVVALLASVSAPSSADVVMNPSSVLFIGNSLTFYNNGIDNCLEGIYAAAGKSINAVQRTTGGQDLEYHFNDSVKIAEIEKGTYDIVVLQGYSNEAYEPAKRASFYEYGIKLDSVIKAAGENTYLFQTWSYQTDITMIEGIAFGYDSLGNAIGATVVPCGRAFQTVDIDSGTAFLRQDYAHPTTGGTYLAACTFYAVFTGESPVGNTFRLSGISDEQARYYQQIAWDAVQTYGPITLSGIQITQTTLTPSQVLLGEVTEVTLSTTVYDADGSIVSVSADLTAVGGGSVVALTAQGGDVWSVAFTTPANLATGSKQIALTATDNDSNVRTTSASLLVIPQGAEGFLLHLPFDETSGLSAQDISGQGNNGTIGGNPTLGVAGRLGTAFAFDAAGDYVQVNRLTSYPDSGFSVSFWFSCADNSGSVFQYLYSHGGWGAASSINILCTEASQSGFGGPNLLQVAFGTNTGSMNFDASALFDGNWHHYVFTIDSVGNGVTYVDGTVRASAALSAPGISPAATLTIGGRSDLNADRFFNGSLDDIRVYAGSLTAVEVAQLYGVTATTAQRAAPMGRAVSLVVTPQGSAVTFQSSAAARQVSVYALDGTLVCRPRFTNGIARWDASSAARGYYCARAEDGASVLFAVK